jgi:hypothetical protein
MTESVDIERIFRSWANLGRSLRTKVVTAEARQKRSFIDTFSVFMTHGRSLRDAEFGELEEVTRRSRERLSPLGEPLEHDLGLNRWLARAREEAYSDWLAWLLAQMSISELAFVLDLQEQELLNLGLDLSKKAVRAEREFWVQRGHEGRQGRLDILLYLQDAYQRDQAIIVLELKRGSADDGADTVKQVGYIDSIENDEKFLGMRKSYVLLVTTSKLDKVHKFEVLRYNVLCLKLRRLAERWMSQHRLLPSQDRLFLAAITLAVIASIETNLLRMSLQKSSFTLNTLSHLRAFIERNDGESSSLSGRS